MKGPWRAAKAWHCESPGEAVGEGAARVAVEVPELKGSCREVEALHHQDSPGKAIGEGAAQLQQKTPAFWKCQYHGMTTKNSSGVEPPGLDAKLVCTEGEAGEETKPL